MTMTGFMSSSKNPCISVQIKKPLCSLPRKGGKGQGALIPLQTQPQTHPSNNTSFFPLYSSQISTFSNSEMFPKGPGYFLPNQPHFHRTGPRFDAVITTEKYLCIKNFPTKKSNGFTNERHDEHS